MKLKIPKLTIKRPAFLTRIAGKPKASKILNAATARIRPAVEEDFDDEPQTRLSSAFFVVLILHVVAVGGIYAFNSIKAHRRMLEPTAAAAPAKPAIEKAAESPAAPPKAQEPIAKTAAPIAPAQVAAANAKVYHVKQGDTLTKIAQSLGVSVVGLQLVNKDTTTLKPGQILNVPAKTVAPEHLAPIVEPPAPNPVAKKIDAPVTKTTAAAPATYEVQKNDTATSIARRFNVSVEDLLKLNKVADPKKLQLGQSLKIPAKKN
jgi:LysM repeat protein